MIETMRVLLLIPLAAVLVVAAGLAACAAAGWNPHARELLVAAMIGLAGAVAGIAPAVALRRAAKSVILQAGLVGTVLQMLLTLLLAAAVAILQLIPLNLAFSIWLLAFYWATLAAVVVAMVSLVGRARNDEPKQTRTTAADPATAAAA